MEEWENGGMWKWGEWENVEMRECGNGGMWKWGNEGMWK